MCYTEVRNVEKTLFFQQPKGPRSKGAPPWSPRARTGRLCVGAAPARAILLATDRRSPAAMITHHSKLKAKQSIPPHNPISFYKSELTSDNIFWHAREVLQED